MHTLIDNPKQHKVQYKMLFDRQQSVAYVSYRLIKVLNLNVINTVHYSPEKIQNLTLRRTTA